jgi:hypothetical protein
VPEHGLVQVRQEQQADSQQELEVPERDQEEHDPASSVGINESFCKKWLHWPMTDKDGHAIEGSDEPLQLPATPVDWNYWIVALNFVHTDKSGYYMEGKDRRIICSWCGNLVHRRNFYLHLEKNHGFSSFQVAVYKVFQSLKRAKQRAYGDPNEILPTVNQLADWQQDQATTLEEVALETKENIHKFRTNPCNMDKILVSLGPDKTRKFF